MRSLSGIAGYEVAMVSTVAFCSALVAFAFVSCFAGATFVMTLSYLRLGAGERWATSFALSLGGFLFVYGLFERALGVPFPAGSLLVWLGYG